MAINVSISTDELFIYLGQAHAEIAKKDQLIAQLGARIKQLESPTSEEPTSLSDVKKVASRGNRA